VNKLLPSIFTLLILASGAAQAVEITGNIGWNSDYVFRGIKLASSSANGGVDITEGNWYAGTWLADVDTADLEGIEIDLYGGWSGQTGDWSYGVGGTGYFYTDNQIDNDYYELNLSGGYQIFTLDVAIGKYDSSPSQDYTFVSGTLEKNGFYGLIGLWLQDWDGSYFEIGYGNTLEAKDVELFDWTFSLISSNEIENEGCSVNFGCTLGDDVSLVLGVKRSFGIYKK